MSRRDDDVFTNIYKILLIAPSWVGPILAAAGYIFLRWLLPAMIPADNFAGSILNHGFAVAAPLIAGLILLTWLISLIAKARRARLFDDQRDLESLRQLSWQEFEKLIGEYFRRLGYTVTEQGGETPDGGIDLELHRAGQRWLVQCKHWKTKSIGVEAIRAFYGVITAESAAGGFFITTGTFTRPAREFARNRIELIDGTQLWAQIQNIPSVKSASPGMMFGETSSPPDPATTDASPLPCPKCDGLMIIKTAKRGPNTGKKFYGCSNFPSCRGTRSIE